MKINNSVIAILLLFLLSVSCKEEVVIPKPKAMLRLEYPIPTEAQLETNNFVFNYNNWISRLI